MRYAPLTVPIIKRGIFLAATGLLLAGCQSSPSTLNPQGPAAARISDLTWVLFVVGGAVYVIVMALLLYALFRRRATTQSSGPPGRERWIIWGGIGLTAVVLLLIFGFAVNTLVAIARPDTADQLTVEVTGHQWWWEVHYPDEGVTTANEIHIPTGEPLEIKLKSQDVIHSFWVPELHGKLDLVPGQTNTFWLQADQDGEYWGICAEYCGIQHAKMQFVVVAQPPAELERWLQAQSQPAVTPTEPQAVRGQEVFMEANCGECHTIAGTAAGGELGPDLTHLASRRTLAAGVVENNRGNLGGWIIDPHGIKPGNLMPATPLSGEDLQALLAYLEILE